MDLLDLDVFRAVANEGGIIRASRKLHRVPSNVTKRIQRLEAILGARLFFRSRQRLFLSPSGELLLSYANRLLQLAEEARTAVGGLPPRGTFRLGSLESTLASRLPGLLQKFHRRYPEVRVELTSGTNDALTAAVADRRLDAAFVAEAPANVDLSHLPVFAERLVLITALAHRPVRRTRDIEGDSLIAFPSGCAYRRVLEAWIGRRGLASAPLLDLASYHAIITCVSSGTGVAVVPESVLDAVRGAPVARHRLPSAVSDFVTPFIWRTAERPPAVLALQELLQERVESRPMTRTVGSR